MFISSQFLAYLTSLDYNVYSTVLGCTTSIKDYILTINGFLIRLNWGRNICIWRRFFAEDLSIQIKGPKNRKTVQSNYKQISKCTWILYDFLPFMNSLLFPRWFLFSFWFVCWGVCCSCITDCIPCVHIWIVTKFSDAFVAIFSSGQFSSACRLLLCVDLICSLILKLIIILTSINVLVFYWFSFTFPLKNDESYVAHRI